MKSVNREYIPIIDILDDVLGDHGSHNEETGQLTYSCPTCSYEIKGLNKLDGKNNLEVNYRKGVFRCWVCSETHDTHGSIYKLIRNYGNKYQLKQYKILRPEDEGEYVRTYKPVELPKEFVSFVDASEGLKMTHFYKRAINYLRSRNVTDDIIEKYDIGFCYKGEYQDRIIIPSYDDDGYLNYFTARSYQYKPFLKYKNPEAQKEIIIFNESLIDWSKPIYLVEGPFDSIFLDNSIPMLGKVMSERLFELLYEKAIKIIIVLDGDAWDNEQKLFHQLNGGRLMGNVYMTHIEGDKDIADLCGDLTNYPPFKFE